MPSYCPLAVVLVDGESRWRGVYDDHAEAKKMKSLEFYDQPERDHLVTFIMMLNIHFQ